MTKAQTLSLIVASLCLGSSGAAQTTANHVVMISVDGLRPAEYMTGATCGEIPPTLGTLMRAGVYATGVTGVLPTVTYPSHATLVTGAYPTKHGVLNNVRARDGADWHYDRSDIQTSTLWDAARDAGLSVGIVTWPSTYGANANYLIPEDLSAVDSVTAMVRRGSTRGLFDSLQAKTGRVKLLSFADLEAGVPLDAMTAGFSVEIIKRYKPNLMLLHFLDLDHREHYEGVESRGACASLKRLDAFIGDIRSAYKSAGILERTTFFIVSDHGFSPLHTILNVREILAQSGWSSVIADSTVNVIDIRSASGSAAVYVKPNVNGVVAARLESTVRPLLEARFNGVVRWVTPDEARKLGGFSGAAFVLCAAPGYSLSGSSAKTRTLVTSSGKFVGTHGYCPDEPAMQSSFIASGSGVRERGAIPRIRMIDIAPTVAATLGLRLPDADGVPIAGILKSPVPLLKIDSSKYSRHVKGVVIDSAGKPVSRVAVSQSFCPNGKTPCYDSPEFAGCTDAKGQFEFDLPHDGLYVLADFYTWTHMLVRVPRHDTATVRITVPNVAKARAIEPPPRFGC